jgi:hypothetical protein
MRFAQHIAAAAVAAAFFAAPADAAAPPNPHDPCARAGRDVCGTTGVGFYAANRYGTRWYGDYRGAVRDVPAAAFCIDLRFWYASRSYGYRESTRALTTRGGAAVSARTQAMMSYAIWSSGRSTTPAQQAAVMLFVHRMMGDARPGELDARVLGRGVTARYATLAQAARRFHGPYRLVARVPGSLSVSRPGSVTVRVVAASGQGVPGVRLRLAGRGVTLAASDVRTDAGGSATVQLTPSVAGPRLTVVTEALAAERPRILVPTVGAAVANGQRLAAPASSPVTASFDLTAAPQVLAAASSDVVRKGSQAFDRITPRGLTGSPVTIGVDLFGPFASRAEIRCVGTPAWSGSVTATTDRAVRSPGVTLRRVGFYAFRERTAAGMSECGRPASTLLATPAIVAGRTAGAARARSGAVVAGQPVRVRLASLGIDAPVGAVGIDMKQGILAIPPGLHRAGWWKEGSAPGASTGAILIAGHVDSSHGGPGAFFRLRHASAGQTVAVTTTGGRTYTYRVVSVQTVGKSALPTSVYSLRGRPRLVLVTCGGPFDARSGHYRDNVVVTAVPA